MPIKIDQRLSNRIANLSLICACLVPSLHIVASFAHDSCAWWIYTLLFKMGVATVAVPIFFVVSGFLLAGHMAEPDWWKLAVTKRCRTILIPYLFWACFYLALNCTLTSVLSIFSIKFGTQGWSDVDCHVVVDALGLNLMLMPRMSHLWYVRSLMVFVLLAPISSVCTDRKGILLVLILLLTSMAQEMWMVHSLAWHLDFMRCAWTWGAMYFCFGVFLRWCDAGILTFGGVWKGFGCILAGIVFFAGAQVINVKSMMVVCRFAASVSSMMGIWLLVPTRKLPTFLTRASFQIYLLHSAVILCCIALFRLCGVRDYVATHFWCWFLQYVLVVAVCVGISALLRQVFPRFSNVIFGGR